MKIQVIVVTYKTPENEIKKLKEEIKNLKFPDYNLSIIDNSIDNIGFAVGVNKGIEEGLKNKADYFLILNPDISLKNINGKKLFDAQNEFDVWGLAMKQNNIFYYGGEIDKWSGSGGLIKKKPNKRFQSCDFVSGSLMMIKKKVIEQVGKFSPDYFMYYEDVDFCFRAKKNGFKVGIDSKPIYDHFETSQKNPKKESFLAKNRLKFIEEYGTLRHKIYKVIKSPFLISFFSLNFSSVVNKIFNFILFVFLVRYFSTEDYGVYNLVWGYVGFFAPFLDFGTTSYGLVYLPKEKNDQLNSLNSLRFYLSLIIFFLIILSTLIFHFDNFFLLYVSLISLTVFANMWSGSYLIINSLKQKLINSSILSVIFNFFLTTVLILGIIKYKNMTYVFLTVALFYVIYALINYYLVKKQINLKFVFKPIDWMGIIKKSYVFVLIGFSAGLYFKQDIFLLKYFKSDTEVGIYSAGYKFFEALLFLAGGYNIVATPILSKLTSNLIALKNKVKKDFLFLFVLSTSISLAFYLSAPLILPLLLKQNFEQSIVVAQIVIFGLPFVLLSSIYLNIIYVFGKSLKVLGIFVLQIFINLILNIIFIPKFSYIASAYITVFSEFINFGLAYILARKYLK